MRCLFTVSLNVDSQESRLVNYITDKNNYFFKIKKYI